MENLTVKQIDPHCISMNPISAMKGRKENELIQVIWRPIFDYILLVLSERVGGYKHPKFFLSRFDFCNTLDEVIGIRLL